MSDSAIIQRLEELEAGRILGDLSSEEVVEWQSLSQEYGEVLDGSLEWTAAQLEAGLATDRASSLPTNLTARVKEGRAEFINEPAPPLSSVPPGGWWNSAPLAWAVAAGIAILLALTWAFRTDPGGGLVEISPLEERAADLTESAFSGLGDFESVTGRAVWSDALQEGFLELVNVPANDPAVRQYQLWIVDPERDEAPVDGGVFDIASDGTVKIPIDAKLRVDQPQAFVITLEQPGGVVRSKQEVVVALAEAS